MKRINHDIFDQALKSVVETFRTSDGRKLWLYNQSVFAFAPLYWKEIQLAQSIVRLRNKDAMKRKITISRKQAESFLACEYVFG